MGCCKQWHSSSSSVHLPHWLVCCSPVHPPVHPPVHRAQCRLAPGTRCSHLEQELLQVTAQVPYQGYSHQPIKIATPFPGAPYLSSQLYNVSPSEALISNGHSITFLICSLSVTPNWNASLMKARIWADFSYWRVCHSYTLAE